MNLPELEAGIRSLTKTYEINRVIEVLKAQQKIVRIMESSRSKAGLSVGDKVTANGRNGSIRGTIRKINRTKAIVDTNSGAYNVPLTMLKAA
tara:strand:- start:6879 stop:7154 length:276 start_codon:yes stop_codon:yes gene_type:complete